VALTALVGPQGPQGVQGIQGDPGATGATGATGPAGAAGADGATWRDGSGAPSNGLGVNGDYYLDTATGDVYKKAAGTYSVVGNIRGATGATGATGSAGLDGKTLHNGSGVPSGGLGVNGDFYIDTTGFLIYGPKAAGVWGSGTSIVGPAGATGATGATGSVGPTGATGPAGAGITAGTIEIDFGASPVNEASVAVTGQTGILASSIAEAVIMGRSTVDNTVIDHEFAAIAIRLSCSEPSAGVGFTIKAFCLVGHVTGKFSVNWRWS
jgi:hypothetical protein